MVHRINLEAPGDGISTRSFYVLLSSICVISLILMCYCFKDFGLWNDEFITLDNTHPFDLSYFNWILYTFKDGTYNFYHFAVRFVYGLNPHTDFFLRLFHEMMLVGSAFIVGITGRALGNNSAGLIASAIFVSQYTIWYNIAQQIRFYPALCLFAALTLYFYVKTTQQQKSKWRYIICFGFSMGLLANTQILAVFLPVVLFIFDAVLWIMRKKPLKLITSYIIALPFGVGFIVYTLMHPGYNVSLGDMSQVSNLDNIFLFPSKLFGSSTEFISGLLLLLYFAAISMYVLHGVVCAKNQFKQFSRINYIQIAIAVIPILSFLLSWLVSFLTSDKYGNLLPRYFQYLYPWLFLTVGLCVSRMLSLLLNGRKAVGSVALCFFLFFTSDTFPKAHQSAPQGMGLQMKYVIENQESLGYDTALLINSWDTYIQFGASKETETELFKEMYLDDWNGKPGTCRYLRTPFTGISALA